MVCSTDHTEAPTIMSTVGKSGEDPFDRPGHVIRASSTACRLRLSDPAWRRDATSSLLRASQESHIFHKPSFWFRRSMVNYFDNSYAVCF